MQHCNTWSETIQWDWIRKFIGLRWIASMYQRQHPLWYLWCPRSKWLARSIIRTKVAMDHKSPSCAWQPHRVNVKGLHHILSLSFLAPPPHKKKIGNSKWSASIFRSHQIFTPSGKRVFSLSTSCCERVGPRCEGVGTGAGCTGRILVEVGRRQKIFGRRDLDAQLWHVYCLLYIICIYTYI